MSKHKIEYEIRERFNKTFEALQISKKKVGRWPFSRWVTYYEEPLIVKASYGKARQAIEERVAIEQDNAVKQVTTYNDRGELHPDHYSW